MPRSQPVAQTFQAINQEDIQTCQYLAYQLLKSSSLKSVEKQGQSVDEGMKSSAIYPQNVMQLIMTTYSSSPYLIAVEATS